MLFLPQARQRLKRPEAGPPIEEIDRMMRADFQVRGAARHPNRFPAIG